MQVARTSNCKSLDDLRDYYGSLHLENGETTLPVFRFTPLAISGVWYSPSSMRCHPSQVSKPPESNMDVGAIEIFTQLYSNSLELHANLIKSLETGSDLAAFAVKVGTKGIKSGNPTMSEWYHALLLEVLNDRLVWAWNVQGDSAAMPSQIPLTRFIAPAEKAEPYRIYQLKWQQTVRNLNEEWKKERIADAEDAVDVVGGLDAVRASLFRGHRLSEAKRMVSTVEGNFAAAALGLSALHEVSYAVPT